MCVGYDNDNALAVGLSRALRAHGVWLGIWERFRDGTSRLDGLTICQSVHIKPAKPEMFEIRGLFIN